MPELQKVAKSVWQFHDKKDELQQVFDHFRFCTNEDTTEPDWKFHEQMIHNP